MIVAIAGGHPDPLHGLLGKTLADLRRQHGCRVLLVDAACGQRLDCAADCFDDVLVAAGDCGSDACRSALAAAQVALVPIAPEEADAARHYALIARLNAARMFNPGLRVLFVATPDGEGTAAEDGVHAVRAYAAEVMSGHVAATVLDRRALLAGPAVGVDGGLAALSMEVFGGTHARHHAAHH
ncbi:hypothetical protein [Massilia sp. TN1-12]|uniref:hypothetical protein n=1 Tax=Massilia paldalensis TaxID=3377675 RepID=UPI00384BBEAE